MSKFPVPVSGEKIPHGWFANLVRFVNSLTLRGDGRYTMVSRNESGTTVTLTPAVKNAIERSGTPPGSGAAQDLSVSVSGGTATVSISGSTSAVQFTAGSNVNITGGTTGEVIVSATGGTAETIGFPDYATAPVSISASTVYPVTSPMWLIGRVGLYKTDSSGFPTWVTLRILDQSGNTIIRSMDLFTDTGTFSSINNYNSFTMPVCLPIPGSSQIEILVSGSVTYTLSLYYT